MDCKHLGPRRGVWNSGGVPYVHHVCAVYGDCTPEPGHPSLKACATCPQRQLALPTVDVVITSRNYGHYLATALESVDAQGRGIVGRVIVVDDASDEGDTTAEIAHQFGVEYLRVEFRSPHLSRGFGFTQCGGPLVLFLDADNALPAGYLERAAWHFADKRRAAIVYPDLVDLVDGRKLLEAPAEFDGAALERQNFIDTGAVWRREVLEQIAAFRADPAGWEDWRLAREVMRSGRWEAIKNSIPLRYRIHKGQRRDTLKGRSYFDSAGLADEVVTIFTTFSARVQADPKLWKRRKEWLMDQTWPRVRLVIANTSHKPMPVDWEAGLRGLFEGISVYTHPVGQPGLEDKNRMGRPDVENAVSTAVAAIYNRMWQETATEFVLILEDDVFPRSTEAIADLMHAMDKSVCAVTGKYRQRYWPYAITAYNKVPENGRPILRLHGPDEGVSEIAGTGFGCVLLRRSQLVDEPIAANSADGPYYDVNLFKRAILAGRTVRIVWGVECDHVGPQMPPPEHDARAKLTILLPTIGRQTLRAMLRTLAQQLTPIDEVWLVSDGPASDQVKQLFYQFNQVGRLVEIEDGPHKDWGHTPRNRVLPEIPPGSYIVHLDDDDGLAPGALHAVRQAILQHPGEMFLFQMRRPDGSIIPDGHEVRPGNVGTPMFVHPSGIQVGTFEPRYGGDHDYIAGTIQRNAGRGLHWIDRPIIDIRPDLQPRAASAPPPDVPAEQVAEQSPGWIIRGWNFATAMARWVRAGMPVRPRAEIERLTAICQRCPQMKDGHCGICGCPVVETNRLIYKLAMVTEHCPARKW